MSNILPICPPKVSQNRYQKHMAINNLNPYELRKKFCNLPPSLILTRISYIKEHLLNEVIKKKTMNNSTIDYDVINNDIDTKINMALENIKYEVFAGNVSQLTEMTVNFLRLLFYNTD